MRTKIAFVSTFAALGALLPATAWGQDAPAATAPAEPPAPAAAAPAEAAPAPTPEAAPAPAAEAPAAPAAETVAAADAPAAWPGWIRIDSDGGGLQAWAGATAPLADGIGLAFDLYAFQLLTSSLGEFDIGPAITAGPVTITPMIGAQFDFAQRTFAALVPQLYVVGTIGPIYEELWLQYYNYKAVYDYGANSFLYLRFFADYKINDYIGVGPQIELTQDFTAEEMVSMPVGGNVMFFQAGAGSTFQFFLGYETKDTFADNHAYGRLSFVHNF
jgi:hypothetical protein